MTVCYLACWESPRWVLSMSVDRRDQSPATGHGAQDPCTVTRAVCLWIWRLGGVGTGVCVGWPLH